MAGLETRELGSTGLSVSALGFGAFELRGAGSWEGPEVTDAEAEAVLNAVLDAGINFIDTSIDYGRSEELIGRFISHRRDEFLIAGKCGCVPGEEGQHAHTAANVRAGVEQSLRRLNTDHLDIVQFHLSLTREEMTRDGALDELLELRDEGKVRFIGSSGTLPKIIKQIDMGVFDAFQIPYSALQREHEDVIDRAAATGAAVIVRGGVAKGATTNWSKATNYMVGPDMMRSRWLDAKLDEVLDGMSSMEFMLRFTLSHPSIDTAIVGTRSIEHFRNNVAVALKGPLPDELLREAKRRLDAAGAAPEPLS